MPSKIDAVHQVVTQGIERLNSAVAHSQQETRQLSSRISVMETGFNYIFHGGSLVTAAAANSSQYQIRSSSLYVSTVVELYRVWYTGSASFPSIVSLDERYGAAWRSGDRQCYSVRLQIIREVDRLASARNISERDAVLLLDAERRQKNWTLNMLSNELRKRNQP
ncbi:transcriptional activator of glycolytic enzymes-domain-containing protein [Lipomyces orientalis]|uniref:Transcriptional activator of glycolytic enzymes-domain-containing protein n=1 Tax=Lipomyces orientalis TaxID=1233043 RepID=A0ACC3TDX1_9ASCO